MLNQIVKGLGTQKSVIRELAGLAAERAKVVGAENVLNFSIGNPSVPAPQAVQDAIIDIIKNQPPTSYHSYSAGNGFEETRKAIADNLNKRYKTDYKADNFYMTCGAAASLSISLKAIIPDANSEIIALAPMFPEYKVFIEAQGGKMVLIPAPEGMGLDVNAIEKAITKNTRGIIVNSPNNPSGVIYPKSDMKKLADMLKKKSSEIGSPIYLITDEPYRELVLVDDEEVTWVPSIYDNTIVCYSWSKSLSLPGERIGYVLVPNTVADKELMAAVGGAGRALGYVCAPTLMQKVIAKVVDTPAELTVYKKNRDLLYKGLTELGYTVAKPSGAFYMFIKSPDGSGQNLSDKAKKRDMMIVPGAGFGVPEYVRLSFCVSTEACEKSLPKFKEIMEEFKAGK